MIVHFNVGKGKALNEIDVSTFTFAPLENLPNVLYLSNANLKCVLIRKSSHIYHEPKNCHSSNVKMTFNDMAYFLLFKLKRLYGAVYVTGFT